MKKSSSQSSTHLETMDVSYSVHDFTVLTSLCWLMQVVLHVRCNEIISGTILNKSSQIVKLSDKGLTDIRVDFHLIFPGPSCCPIMHFRTSENETLPEPDPCFVKAGKVIPNKHFVSLSDSYADKCSQTGTQVLCNGTQAFSYLLPRYWFVVFGYECGDHIGSTASIQYTFILNKDTEENCEKLSIDETCDRYVNGSEVNVYFPNRFGHKNQAEALQNRRHLDVFSTLSNLETKEHCYQHINSLLCISLYPGCNPVTEVSNAAKYAIPCRRMCQELFLGCRSELEIEGIIECEAYPDGLPPDVPCIYMAVECPKFEDTSLNMTISGYKLNDTAEFHCEEGFVLEGAKLLKCMASGRWNSSVPKCRPRDSVYLSFVGTVVGVAVLCIILLTTPILGYYWHRKRWCCKTAAPNADIMLRAKPKVFLSFCSEDRDDAEEFLQKVKKNVREREFFTYHDAFHPGEQVVEAIQQGVWIDSDAMITFLTQGFIDSEWCRHEFSEAFKRARNEPKFRFIVVMNMSNEEVKHMRHIPKDMSTCLKERIYLCIDDPEFWRKISEALCND